MRHQEIDVTLELLCRADEESQAATLRIAAERAYEADLIRYDDRIFITDAIDQGALCKAAGRLVPEGTRYGVWRSSHGQWHAEVDCSASFDEWRASDPIGYAADCDGPVAAIAIAGLRARITQLILGLTT